MVRLAVPRSAAGLKPVRAYFASAAAHVLVAHRPSAYTRRRPRPQVHIRMDSRIPMRVLALASSSFSFWSKTFLALIDLVATGVPTVIGLSFLFAPIISLSLSLSLLLRRTQRSQRQRHEVRRWRALGGPGHRRCGGVAGLRSRPRPAPPRRHGERNGERERVRVCRSGAQCRWTVSSANGAPATSINILLCFSSCNRQA